LEQPDQAGVSIGDIFFKNGSTLTPDVRRDLLGGITALKVPGFAAEKSLVDEPLYQPLSVSANRAKRNITLMFVPYYTVGNRETSAMEVWVPLAKGDAAKTEASNAEAIPVLAEKHSDGGRKGPSGVQ
jgi:hypothetical protein